MQILQSVCTFQKNFLYAKLLILPLDYRALQTREYRIDNVWRNVHLRMSAYSERTRSMPNVPLTYLSVCEHDDIRCSVTALLRSVGVLAHD